MLKKLDILGTSFFFSIQNKDKYKTSLGGAVTIISFIVILAFIYLFGIDFFYKLNPKINIGEIKNNISNQPLVISNDNFLLAWRIENKNYKYENIEGRLIPKLRYVEYIKDNNTKEFNLKILKNVPYQICDKLNSSYILQEQNFNPSNWYCLDWSDFNFTLGGSWESDFLNFFYISITSNSINITSYLKESKFISFLFPYYYLDINNSTLLKIKYKNYYYKLGTRIGKNDRIYLKRIFSNDDKGWMIEDIYNRDIISTDTIKSDYYYIEADVSTKELYSSVFYLDNDHININRSYMKIQDLGAQIGGLIKLIMTISIILITPYNINRRNEYLFNQIFNNKEYFKNKNLFQENKNLNTSKIRLDSEVEGDNLYKMLKLGLTVKKLKSIKFGLFKTLRFKLCSNYSQRNHKNEFKKYNFFISYIRDRLDIANHFKFIENVKFLRNILLNNPEQNNSFEFIKNPDISDEKDLNLFCVKIEKDKINEAVNVVNYFRTLKFNNRLTQTDKQIYQVLNPVIKRFIGKIDNN